MSSAVCKAMCLHGVIAMIGLAAGSYGNRADDAEGATVDTPVVVSHAPSAGMDFINALSRSAS